MIEQTAEREPFEIRRWNGREVRVFAAMDTMDQIAERVLAIVGEGRVMNKIATYVHSDGLDDLSRLDHATGLRKGGHAGHPVGHHTWKSDDQSGFSVYLTHRHGNFGSMEGFGVGVMAYNAPTEKQVRARHEKAKNSKDHFDRFRDLTYLEIKGSPGEPHRDDRIEVMHWNEHGVLRHTIITFVEPDYCDSGRVIDTEYVILAHRVDPDRKPYSAREEDAEVLARFTGPDIDLDVARTEVRRAQAQPDIDFAWLAEEKIVRERRSI